jgi:hypothetical protein
LRSASLVAVSTRPETARARSRSDVTKTSLQLRQCHELGVVGRLPAKLVSDPPRRPLQHLVTEEADLQRVDPRHPLESVGGRDLAPPSRLVQRGQRLRADERGRDELVLGRNVDLAGRDPKERVAVDDETRHAAEATGWLMTTTSLRETHLRV